MTDDARPGDGNEQADNVSAERERLKRLLRERADTAGESSESGSAGHEGQTTPDWTPLVPIQPLGSKPPFFMVHAILGSVFPYHRLALALGADRPVYGLQSRGLDGAQPPIETIPEMASVYLDAIQQVQPTGPYHLGGYSMGGWIAYEIAQQLRVAGETVPVLAALGTPAPMGGEAPGADAWRWTTKYMEDYFTLWRNAALSDSPELRDSFFGQQGAPGAGPFGFPGGNPWGAPADPAQAGGGGGFPPLGGGLPQQGPTLRVALTNAAAQVRYVAEKSEGGVDVFLSTEQTALYQSDATMGWKNLCSGDIAVYHVNGNHLNLFQEPQVLELADKLTRRLDGAPSEGEADG